MLIDCAVIQSFSNNAKILAWWGSADCPPCNSYDFIELIEEGDCSNLKFIGLIFYLIF